MPLACRINLPARSGPVRPPSVCAVHVPAPVFLSLSLSLSLSLPLSLPLDVVGLEGVSEGDRAKAAHYKYWTKFRRTRDHSSRTLPSHIFGVWPEPRRFAAAGVGNGVSLLTGMAGQGARMICGDTFSPARHFYGLESRNNNFMTILRRQATKRHLQTRVFTIPILFHGIVTIWRAESPRNRKPNSRFYSKMESFGTEN